MDKEYRSPNYGGIEQPGDSREASEASRVSDLFTIGELGEMLAARAHGCANRLPINRRKCVEQINLLERQRRDIDRALAELRQIYTEIFTSSNVRRAASGTT